MYASSLLSGLWTIGTAVHLIVPASFVVLVGNLRRLARRGLLARGKFRSLASSVAGGERLGVRTVSLGGPPAVMLDNFISDRAHMRSSNVIVVWTESRRIRDIEK